MDKDVPSSAVEKVEDQRKQPDVVQKTTLGTDDAISTAAREEKSETVPTELTKLEVTETEANETKVAKTEANETKVAKTEANETKVAKTEVSEAEMAKMEMNETEVNKPEVARTELVKTEMDKTELTAVVKTETVIEEADKTEMAKGEPEVAKGKPEVAKGKPEVADTEPKAVTAQPKTTKTDSKLVSTELDVAKAQLASVPEVAKIVPEVNRTTPADAEHAISGPDSGKTEHALSRTEPNGRDKEGVTRDILGSGSSAESSLGSPLRSATIRTRHSIESDSEIAEILRGAPPPTMWEEEVVDVPSGGETGGGVEETGGGGAVVGDMETVVIMKKTFTESVKPDQEFIPISESSDYNDARKIVHSLQTVAIPAPITPQEFAKNLETDGRQTENGTGPVAEPEMTGDEESVLSKAQMEARDLASEFRRLQYLLENLSAFSDLEPGLPGELQAPQEQVEPDGEQVSGGPLTRKAEPAVELK